MCKNVCIGVTLALAFGLVVVVLAILGVLSFALFGSLDRHAADLTNPSLAAAANSVELQHAACEAPVSDAKLTLAATLLCGILLAAVVAWTITQGFAELRLPVLRRDEAANRRRRRNDHRK